MHGDTMKRRFQDTHKWIKFDVNMNKANTELWLTLGECQSKCEHLARYPIRPDIADQIHRIYLAKGVFATAAIEGNTLTEQEVRKILDGELELPPSREYLGTEVQNVIEECNNVLEQLGKDDKGLYFLTADRIKNINRAILDGLDLPDHVIPGEYRNYDVGVGIYKGAPHEDCDYLMKRLVEWLNDPDNFGAPDHPRAKVYAILKAVVAHLYLAWIHPFGDGNGRTARMMEFQILLSSGIPSPAAHLLSNHYYLTRAEYYRQLQQASDNGGDILPFIYYAVQGFLDGLKEQLVFMKQSVMDAVWKSYIADQFGDSTEAADVRRRDLIEDMSSYEVSELMSADHLMLISARVSKHYKNRTRKTLLRDLKRLQEMGLIKFDKGLIKPRKEAILAFIPPSTAEAGLL